MKINILCLYFMLISENIIAYGERTPTAQEKLYEKLLKNYSKNSRPIKDQKLAINVSFSFELKKLYEVNAKLQRMSIVSLVREEWYDESLIWNASEYSGFFSINISPYEIWVPDIGLYNEIPNKDHKKTGIATHVVVDSNGRCRWTYPLFLHVMCSIDVSYFPLDLQECSLRFGSLVFSAAELQITQFKPANMFRTMSNNGEWLLYKTRVNTNNVYDDIRSNNFSVVKIVLNLERNSGYYFIEMLVPCFLISFLTIVGFVLPPESGERMSLGMLILLAMTFFQQLAMKMVPLQDFPLISQYFLITTIEIGIALLIMTLTLNFYHHSHSKVPRLLRLAVINVLGKIIRINDDKNHKKRRSSHKLDRNFNSYKLERNSQLSNSSKGSNSNFKFDMELPESNENASISDDILEPSLYASTIGLVSFKAVDDNTSSTSSFEMKDNRKDHNSQHEQNLEKSEQNGTDEVPNDWNKDWILVSRILDRFSMYASIVIGILTVLIVFLRAPRFWQDKTGAG